MQTDAFFEKYYDDALKINAICVDLSLPGSDAKLYTYIHIKALENDGVECFEDESPSEIKALEVLLGKTKQDGFRKLSRLSQKRQGYNPEKIADKLRGIEMAAKVNFGFEFPFKYELINRLRFHTNPEYRDQKIDFYITTISPRMRFYTENDVKQAFENEQKRLKKISDKLSGLI